MPVQVDVVQDSRDFPRVQVLERARELLVRVVPGAKADSFPPSSPAASSNAS
jgi:hypothetical protein